MTQTTHADLTRTDRLVLRTVQLGAWAGLAATVGFGLLNTISSAGSGVTAARLAIYGVPPASGSTTVLLGGRQRVEAHVFVERVPQLFADMAVGADAVRALGIGLILLGIALLAGRMLRGRPFTDAAGTPLGLVLVGTAAAPTIADALEGWVSTGTFEAMGEPANYAPVATFTPMPVVLGLAIAALMIAFRIAARMQRDTDGLV